MGEYSEMQRSIIEHQEDYELKTIKVKRLFNIPIIHIKQSKFEKVWNLFNFIPIFKIVNYGGFENEQN